MNLQDKATAPSKKTGCGCLLNLLIGCQSMQWNDGELADVRITYSGFMDVVRRKQLILREVHVGKAHLTVVDAKQPATATPRAPSRKTSRRNRRRSRYR